MHRLTISDADIFILGSKADAIEAAARAAGFWCIPAVKPGEQLPYDLWLQRRPTVDEMAQALVIQQVSMTDCDPGEAIVIDPNTGRAAYGVVVGEDIEHRWEPEPCVKFVSEHRDYVHAV